MVKPFKVFISFFLIPGHGNNFGKNSGTIAANIEILKVLTHYFGTGLGGANDTVRRTLLKKIGKILKYCIHESKIPKLAMRINTGI